MYRKILRNKMRMFARSKSWYRPNKQVGWLWGKYQKEKYGRHIHERCKKAGTGTGGKNKTAIAVGYLLRKMLRLGEVV